MAFLSIVCGPLQAQEVTAKIAEITTQFQEAYDRDVDKPHLAAIADLNSKYDAALKRSLDEATAAGNLEEALKLRTETDRLTQKQPLPPVDLDSLPESLKQLRATYRSALAKLDEDRDAKSQPFYDQYDNLLEALQTELTQAQKLDDALAVKAKRDAIALDRPKIAAPEPEPAMAAATSNPPPEPSTTSSSAIPTSSSPWRAAAEWVLSLKGQLYIEKDGRKLGVQDLDKLPPGKFDILYVTFSRYSKHDGMKMTDADLTLLNPIAKNLERLTLANCNINGSGLEAIAGATKLKELSLYSCPVTDDALKHLAGLESLEDLNVGFTQTSGTGFVHLRSLAKLRKLGVNATLITEEGGQALAALTQIEELSATSRSIKGTGESFTKHVGKLVNLKMFNFGEGAPVTDACLEPLQGLSKLELVGFGNSRISGTGFAWLKASANTLKFVHLPYTCPITDEAVEIIVTNLPNIERLQIGYGGSCGPKAIRMLASLPRLKSLTWRSKGFMTSADYALFAALPALNYLSMPDAEAFDEIAAAAIATCPKVTQLRVPRSLTDAGLAEFEGMKGLRELNCSSKLLSEAAIAAFKKARPDVKFGH